MTSTEEIVQPPQLEARASVRGDISRDAESAWSLPTAVAAIVAEAFGTESRRARAARTQVGRAWWLTCDKQGGELNCAQLTVAVPFFCEQLREVVAVARTDGEHAAFGRLRAALPYLYDSDSLYHELKVRRYEWQSGELPTLDGTIDVREALEAILNRA